MASRESELLKAAATAASKALAVKRIGKQLETDDPDEAARERRGIGS